MSLRLLAACPITEVFSSEILPSPAGEQTLIGESNFARDTHIYADRVMKTERVVHCICNML